MGALDEWARRVPAVRFRVILICSLVAAVALGRLTAPPRRRVEWMLLVIGLPNIPLVAALTVIAWLFFLAWHGHDLFQRLGEREYKILQIFLLGRRWRYRVGASP